MKKIRIIGPKGGCDNCENLLGYPIVKGICRPCYNKNYHSLLKVGLKKVKPKTCSSCGGDDVYVKGFCRSCYNKNYHLRKSCIGCGCNFPKGSSKDFCFICRKQQQGKVDKKIINFLTFEQKVNIRLILLRFKYGFHTAIDFYKVVDIYLDIFEVDAKLDLLVEMDQVRYMLKKLKNMV